MKKDHLYLPKFWLIVLLMICGRISYSAQLINLRVDKASEGAPLTMGIPFAQGDLLSPDHVRVLDKAGNEIASQTTLVTTWAPLDYSVKWLWVFFFSTGDTEYMIEYGPEIRKMAITGDCIKIRNAQRKGQTSYVDTGPLRFSIRKRDGGFIDNVQFDVDRDGFDKSDTIATSDAGRGSFLDLLDELGIDSSRAAVHRTVRERGSGPLHTIMRLEGTYTYGREDNRDSPFVIRIHLYAGKSYIRVLHTLTYTGIPDKHSPVPGEHANIALSGDVEIIDDSQTIDSGWMQANDQIAATGLSLTYNLADDADYYCAFKEGAWYAPKKSRYYSSGLKADNLVSLFQTGPKPDRIPPVPNSGGEKRIGGFKASIRIDEDTKESMERADGWADISDDRWGIGIGIRNFIEEYPKEIVFDQRSHEAIAYFWSPAGGPLNLSRSSLRRDQGMISNFAEGITKTSELVFYFHKKAVSRDELKSTMDYFLDPPVAHAEAKTYSESEVFGKFAPRSSGGEEFERSLEYKFDWQIFNQHWEPWYGMLDFGDQKNMYFRDDWYRWQNNEPAIDFMYWLQFMRTGHSKYYFAAEAMSRHTMDVDNIHWPADPPYYGDTNESLDYWKHEMKKSVASPYLGIGRRHANQHWSATLSAHVWIKGWLASYYLTGYHRGLDIAKLSADSYLRRIWGEHGLTGRRLYLSVWNLVEAWDATKDPKYLEDLCDRVDRMLALQNGADQYDNLAIDRYGYSQIYASHGLYKYYQLTKEERVKQALIRHARAVRDNPPYNHEYESYLATIHSLVIGHEFTGEQSFLDEAKKRAEIFKTDKLSKTFDELGNQKNIAQALQEVSHLPTSGIFRTRPRRDPSQRWFSNWDPTQGLRVFGWTHIYNVPWLMHWLDKEKD